MANIDKFDYDSSMQFKIQYLLNCAGSYSCLQTPCSIYFNNSEIILCFRHIKLIAAGVKSLLENIDLKEQIIDDIAIKRVDCGYCEYEGCDDVNFVNILGIHFDIWLCQKHLYRFYEFIKSNIDCIGKLYLETYNNILDESQIFEKAECENAYQYKNLDIYYEIINRKYRTKGKRSVWIGRSECNKYVEKELVSMQEGHTKTIILPFISSNLSKQKSVHVMIEVVKLKSSLG